jgi:E3 ubiquitin-protein ligase UBR7
MNNKEPIEDKDAQGNSEGKINNENNQQEPEKEEEFTLNEYLNLLDKEILFISKLEKNEHDELKKCTYDKGYITQEVYVCLTCSKEKNTLSGICLACAFKCHLDHEVENLHFKRNFRCDCGNSNFCKYYLFDIISHFM